MLALAVIFLLQVPFFIQYIIILPDPAYLQPKFWAASGVNFNIFANADLATLLEYNLWQGQQPKWIMNSETGALWNFLGLFFAGIVIARKALFSERKPNLPYLLSAGVLSGLAISTVSLRDHYGVYFEPPMHKWVFEEGLTRVYNFCIVGLYLVLGIVFYRMNVGRFLLKPFVACGRASLSLYILQTIIFVPLFYGFGLGWYETIGQANALLLGIFAWGVQMIAAKYWLAYYRYAPVEGFWRKLTQYNLRVSAFDLHMGGVRH